MNKRTFLKSASLLGAGLLASNGAHAVDLSSPEKSPLKKVSPLPKKGTIGVVSTSAATANQKDIIFAKQVIEALGYKAKLAPNIMARRGHLAGTDAQRAGDLKRFIC